ncbi:MAG: hypothetical protein GKR91_19780 [Pseudomonadales bacterium]|nr:hypothetical protein [Pseudomonadales bacterium]
MQRTLYTLLVISLCQVSSIAYSEEADHGYHGAHHFSVLSGETSVRGHGDYATLGIDYEYRLNQRYGIGFVIEHAFDDLEATTALAVANWHVYRGWVVQFGSGFEHYHDENIFTARTGVRYDFELSGFTLSPQVHWNYHEDHHNAVVAGIAIGFSF